MWTQIASGIALVAATALIQAFAMLTSFHGLDALRAQERRFKRRHTTTIVVLFVLYMFVAMLVEMAAWAWAFLSVGAVRDFETALYVSIGSFTTSGYHEGLVATPWRLLVAFEGGCGMLIFGWATALVIAAIQHLHVWPQPRAGDGTAVAARDKKS